MSSRVLVVPCVFLVACGGAAASTHTAAASGDLHEIHLARTMAVGAGWGEVTHFVERQHQTVHGSAGAVVQETTTATTIELAGEYVVVTNGPDGEPGQVRLTVERFTVDTGTGATTPAVPSVLLIDRGPGTIAGANGEAIAEATVELLRRVVPEHAHQVSDDVVFGTREPQAIGASWPIDAAGAAHGLEEVHLTVDPGNVSGTTTLVSAGNEAGHDVLSLHTVITAHHVGMPGLPPGSVTQRAEIEANVEYVLPVDRSVPPLRDSARSHVDAEVTVQTPAGPATVDVVVEEEETHVRTPR